MLGQALARSYMECCSATTVGQISLEDRVWKPNGSNKFARTPQFLKIGQQIDENWTYSNRKIANQPGEQNGQSCGGAFKQRTNSSELHKTIDPRPHQAFHVVVIVPKPSVQTDPKSTNIQQIWGISRKTISLSLSLTIYGVWLFNIFEMIEMFWAHAQQNGKLISLSTVGIQTLQPSAGSTHDHSWHRHLWQRLTSESDAEEHLRICFQLKTCWIYVTWLLALERERTMMDPPGPWGQSARKISPEVDVCPTADEFFHIFGGQLSRFVDKLGRNHFLATILTHPGDQ